MAETDYRVDVRELVGVSEIAALFLVGRSTVTQWQARNQRNGFPEPIHRLAMGPLWNVNAVLSWYASYVPDKGGRPGRYPGAGQLAGLSDTPR